MKNGEPTPPASMSPHTTSEIARQARQVHIERVMNGYIMTTGLTKIVFMSLADVLNAIEKHYKED